MPIIVKDGKIIGTIALDPVKLNKSLREFIRRNQKVFDALSKGQP